MDGEIKGEIGGERMSNFDLWCFGAPSKIMMDGKPLPVLTELLHRVCDGDTDKFTEAVEIMRSAFEAGAKMGK